jgi:hypothetical protein
MIKGVDMKTRKMISVIALALIAFFLGVSPVYAGDPARTGTAGGEQLLVPVGARDLAMGGSNVAYSADLDAIYWNPAGFSSMNSSAMGTFSTMTVFNDVNVNYLALGFNAARIGHIGFSIKAFDFGDIPLTTNEDYNGASGATFSPSFVTVGLTYSRKLSETIQVGFNTKLVSESVPRASASAVAFDVGIQYHELGGINGLSMGLVVKNIGTNLQYNGSAFLVQQTGSAGTEFREIPTASHQLPAYVELGVGYRRQINELNSVTVNGNFVSNNFGNDDFKFGAEYSYNDIIFLRGGYLQTQKVDSEDQLYRFTLGVGLKYQLSGTDLRFDYAFRDSQYFDGNNLFQLTVGF